MVQSLRRKSPAIWQWQSRLLKAASLTFNVSFEVLYQAYKEGDCLVTFLGKTALGYRFEVAYGGGDMAIITIQGF